MVGSFIAIAIAFLLYWLGNRRSRNRQSGYWSGYLTFLLYWSGKLYSRENEAREKFVWEKDVVPTVLAITFPFSSQLGADLSWFSLQSTINAR